MQNLTLDEKFKIISSEIYNIYNIQVFLEQAFSLIELDSEFEIQPHLMLIQQQKTYIKNIISLI